MQEEDIESGEALDEPPLVMICGRPNVGKTTLFNRLAKRHAITSNEAGTTHDLLLASLKSEGRELNLMDSPGWLEGDNTTPHGDLNRAVAHILPKVTLALLVIDSKEGVTSSDRGFTAMMRTSGIPIRVVANKSEGKDGMWRALQCEELGLGSPWPVSAEHGDGCDLLEFELFEAVGELIGNKWSDTKTRHDVSMTIVGFPNAGKSTLVNALLQEEIQMVGEAEGSTRDTTVNLFPYKEQVIKLVDTAGLRRRAKTVDELELEMQRQATQAVRHSELVILLTDVTRLGSDALARQDSLPRQESVILDYALREGRAVIVAFNKFDLLSKAEQSNFEKKLAPRICAAFAGHRMIPWVTLSAKNDDNFDGLLDKVNSVHASWCHRVSTGQLNRVLQEAVAAQAPVAVRSQVAKPRYLTQIKARPPTIAMFCSRPMHLTETWKRFLINRLRAEFGWDGVPIRLSVRSGDNPYVESPTEHKKPSHRKTDTREGYSREGRTREGYSREGSSRGGYNREAPSREGYRSDRRFESGSRRGEYRKRLTLGGEGGEAAEGSEGRPEGRGNDRRDYKRDDRREGGRDTRGSSRPGSRRGERPDYKRDDRRGDRREGGRDTRDGDRSESRRGERPDHRRDDRRDDRRGSRPEGGRSSRPQGGRDDRRSSRPEGGRSSRPQGRRDARGSKSGSSRDSR